MFEEITPMVLTFNEAPNIRRTLEKLGWAREILVVDSFSTDETLEIVRSFPGTKVVQRKFDTFAGQCNFGLEQIRTSWVLSMDADYVLGDGFAEEVAALQPEADVAGFRAGFVYCIHGRRLRATLYPPRVVLYRRDRAKYLDEGHGHRVRIEGRVLPLRARILHDDRKPLDRWLGEQNRYAVREVEHLFGSREQRAEDGGRGTEGGGELNVADKVRKWVVVAPFAIFLYTLLGKGLIFDGWPGWYYVFQRTLAEMILSLRLLEHKLKQAGKGENYK